MVFLDRYWFRPSHFSALAYFQQAKIKIANCVAILLLTVMLGYALFSALVYPPLTWLPASAFGVLLAAYLILLSGGHQLYRCMLSVVPMLVAAGYHAFLAQPEATPIPSIWLFQMAFLLLPFVLFDRREYGWQLFGGLINTTLILAFDPLNAWLDLPLDDTLFREGPMHYLTSGFSLLMGIAAVAIMGETNFVSEIKNFTLLQKSKEQAEKLQEREQAMQQQLALLEENKRQEEQRSWASNGHAHFASLLREYQDQELYDTLISEVVKYLDANQGGIFIYQEESSCLELKAAYGYGRKKFLQKTIEKGEGLLGQCFLEKDLVYLTELPQGYTYITSGLGDATPNALLFIPLIYNDTVVGVLELASFKSFEAHQQEFLMKLGEDMAATLQNQQINGLTNKLLQEAKQQAEEMRAQEEEMRQNMEELSATQEEMQRKEQEYIHKITDLEQQLRAVEQGIKS